MATLAPSVLIESSPSYAGNEYMHKRLNGFEFWPDPTIDYIVIRS